MLRKTIYLFSYRRIAGKGVIDKRWISNERQRIKKTRLTVGQFNWQSNCFYCGTECIKDQKNPNRKDWHLASRFETKENIVTECD